LATCGGRLNRGTRRWFASRRRATSVPEQTENCGHQRPARGISNSRQPGHAQVDPLRETTFKVAGHAGFRRAVTLVSLPTLHAARRTLASIGRTGERSRGWGKPVCRLPVARLPWRLWT
jgi:hypothetical protein